jgi:hypothetical protein
MHKMMQEAEDKEIDNNSRLQKDQQRVRFLSCLDGKLISFNYLTVKY